MDPGNIGSADKASVFESLARVVKAMANGRRLELIELLAQGEHSVETLARMTGMGVTTVSGHLQTLKQSGLVATRRERTTIFYRLAGDDVAEFFLAAKRVGLRHYPDLRQTLVEYMEQADAGRTAPSIDPSAVTSEMTVVDVRPTEEFEAGHFPGALSIPLAELPDRYREIPTGTEVVVYCRGEFCSLAREAARWLGDHGVDAKAMDEGVVEWRVSKEVDLGVA
ncbi:ArsR/SmtB family transcription factor [Prescottella agglutinans]|uniref:Rhodanese-related sulfurtransferase/DNA-binding transcriptional ArsR family regulator n=1 Tax=Prescottella agglutinans TaxID=1644129 RepID=A0ABT6MBJ8_9NOCA|nr:metalloregulator ArsR/SmtB family transcription factor [Prescottella agglutinans]MDH6281677.1 rhodanese-related sulfurtransferase/DNA-binding transcriptional ArsR family regulator [Prescottella agglutinans]